MKPSPARIGLIAALSILALAASLAGSGGASAQTTASADYDGDNDGFINITTLAQLNAIRYDPRGSGSPSVADRANYAAAFPNAVSGMGCPSSGCKGYELDNDLSFDTDDNDILDSGDAYPNWTPIGGNSPFRATFEGNGHAISYLKVSGAPEKAGLFGELRGAKVRNLGLLKADVSSTEDDSGSAAGALAGAANGVISNVYAIGKVSGGSDSIGGLVGIASGANTLITSSWANVEVKSIEENAQVGGLAGGVRNVDIYASFALGDASASGEGAIVGGLVGQAKGASVNIRAAHSRAAASATGDRATAGGFLGKNSATSLNVKSSYSTGRASGATSGAFIASGSATVSDSYWDTVTSRVADDSDTTAPEGKTTTELQTPTSATGIFANWDDLDLTDDNAANAVDDPWNFGTNSQYPAIAFGTVAANVQRAARYDEDGDGFIDVDSLARMNAIRYDLDGDGAASRIESANYAAAFPNALSGMGCPSAGCKGYELKNDLTFDTDGDGDVDANDAYPSWTPIGNATNAFGAAFKGNGKTIAKMTIDSAASRVGLFGAVSATGKAERVNLTDVDLASSGIAASAGALAGANAGTITSASAGGNVSSTGTGAVNVGGLVGDNSGTIISSWARTTVSAAGAGGNAGGLAGADSGKIFASWARAAVSSTGAGGNVGGLVGELHSGGVLKACYARGSASGGGANAKVGGLIGATAGAGNSVSACFAAVAVAASGTGGARGGLVASPMGTTAYSASYWAIYVSGIYDDADWDPPEGRTSGALMRQISPDGIYDGWDALDLSDDGVSNAVDAPWNFGTQYQYPVLTWGGMNADDQHDDYDADDDGLIDITSLKQLDAMRYDLPGGMPPTDRRVYWEAFFNSRVDMGCPSAGCRGYELMNDLTFDTDGDGDVDADDAYPNWTPIGDFGGGYNGAFEGNGKTISKMKISATSAGSRRGFGLFGEIGEDGTVKGVGLLDADVSVIGTDNAHVGALAGAHFGTIEASYATGKVTSNAHTIGGFAGSNDGWIAACWANVSVASSKKDDNRTGAFVGINYARIVASYSRGGVSAYRKVGGLAGSVGRDAAARVRAFYAVGKVESEKRKAGGLTSTIWNQDDTLNVALVFKDSYWDAESTGVSVAADAAGRARNRGEGKTTAELQTPTSAVGIYANWNALDLTNDGVDNPVDAPWSFGTNKQYPVLVWGGLRAEDQYEDYDADDDGLIDITALSRLDGIRYDLNGDGESNSAGDYAAHAAAFPYAVDGMGCPDTGCVGYELRENLTFDTDGDGDVDASDAYPNWQPIGDLANGFATTFDGGGKTISKMKIAEGASLAGLFGAISPTGIVKGVGLLDASVTATGGARAGALAGDNAGTITSSYAKGAVSFASDNKKTHSTGGLVGVNRGMIAASWANVAASSSGYQDSVGGFAGINYGKIVACYAEGAVSSTGARSVAAGFAGGNSSDGADIKSSYSTGAASATGTASIAAPFIGWGNGAVSDSYWDSTASGASDDADSASPEGKTTAALKTPTTATGIYDKWDDLDLTNDGTANPVDDPWNFGTNSQYPALEWGDLKAAAQRP